MLSLYDSSTYRSQPGISIELDLHSHILWIQLTENLKHKISCTNVYDIYDTIGSLRTDMVFNVKVLLIFSYLLEIYAYMI